MSNASDFVISDGWLSKNTGPGGDVRIPEGLTEILHVAGFQGNDSIISVIIPEGVTKIGLYLFQNCRNLAHVVLPDSLTEIGAYVFKGCERLTNIHFPKGLKSIGNHAFQDCANLTEAVLPDGITSLGDEAFAGCKGLKSVTLKPEGLRYLGQNVFADCKKLVDKSGMIILGGSLLYRYEGKGGDVIIPAGVRRIFDEAFRNRKKVTSVVIPEGVTIIDANAFSGCSGLVSVELPSTLKEIRAEAFRGCKALRSVVVPNGVEIIEEGAFQNCESLERVELPASVQTIPARTFFGCKGLRYISLPKKLQSKVASLFDPIILTERVAKGALSFDPGTEKAFLAKATGAGSFQKLMAAGIKTDNAASVSWLLSKWEKPNLASLSEFITAANQGKAVQSLTVLLDYQKTCFTENDLSEYEMSQQEKELGLTEKTVDDWRKALKFVVKNGQICITGYKVKEKHVEIPARIGEHPVEEIIGGAFFNQTEMQMLSIENGVSVIGKEAFSGCRNLTDVQLPDSISEIADSLFRFCDKLSGVAIPKGVVIIGDYAFSGCGALTEVTIPNSLKTIGNWSFSGCGKLSSIMIPDGVEILKGGAFYGCKHLMHVTLPQSVNHIENNTFAKCANLTIHAPAGSYAEQYAKENKIPFVAE